jgi:hypothetical protein
MVRSLQLNPYTWPIEGDLSRADAVVLTLLSRGKKVIEFGIGGSTVLFSQVADKVITYEHDPAWVEKMQPSLNDKVEIRMIEKKDSTNFTPEECDVIFDDGWSVLRDKFLLQHWPYTKECAILHDARMTYAGNVCKKFFDAFTIKNEPCAYNPGLPDNPYTGSLKRIDWCWLESNMVVLHKRNCTLYYENWKITEK